MTLLRLCGGLFAAAVIATSSGCLLVVAAAAGVGTYAYVDGELESSIEASLDRTYAATLAAMEELQYPVKSSGKDGTTGKVTGREFDGTEITVKLERQSEAVTQVSVRFGVFGSEAKSGLLVDKIREKLR
jgi:hypothetical protein